MAGPRKKSPKPDVSGHIGTPISEAKWCRFLAELSRTANVTKSCELAGFERTAVYRRRNDDPEFATQFDAAYRAGYEVLEEMAAKRAFDGYDQVTYDGEGNVVKIVEQYSDALAMFLLKGNTDGKFRDRVETSSGDRKEGRFSRLTAEELDAELKRRLG